MPPEYYILNRVLQANRTRAGLKEVKRWNMENSRKKSLGVLIVFTLLNRVPSGKFNRVNNKLGFGVS